MSLRGSLRPFLAPRVCGVSEKGGVRRARQWTSEGRSEAEPREGLLRPMSGVTFSPASLEGAPGRAVLARNPHFRRQNALNPVNGTADRRTKGSCPKALKPFRGRVEFKGHSFDATVPAPSARLRVSGPESRHSPANPRGQSSSSRSHAPFANTRRTPVPAPNRGVPGRNANCRHSFGSQAGPSSDGSPKAVRTASEMCTI